MEMYVQALLYIAAEDEAFLAYNGEMDAQSLVNERKSVPSETEQSDPPSETDQSDPSVTDSEELLQLDGKSISEWLSELDTISKEVEAELVSRDIGCHLVQVLDAVNAVLFDWRGFKRATTIALDPECFYIHSVLNHRCSTGKTLFLSSLGFSNYSSPFSLHNMEFVFFYAQLFCLA